MKHKSSLLIASIISGIFLLIGISVLPHYGQNWDEAAHFFRGQAFLNFFLTGNKNFTNLPSFKIYHQKDTTVFFDPVDKEKKEIPRRSMYQYDGLGFAYWTTSGGGGHPPFSDIISALFNFVFFQKLGLISDVESYHLYSVFLSSILIGVIYWWVRKEYGRFAALIASMSLALYPLFLGESHFNIKDPPQAVFYGLTIIAFYEAIVKRSRKWMIFSSVFSAFAFATKFNVIFLPLIVLPWLFLVFFFNKAALRRYLFLLPSVIIYPIVILATFFATWPFLWAAPLENFKKVIDYYGGIGTGSNFDLRYLWYFKINTYAIQRILFSTPLIILVLSMGGIFYSLRSGFSEKRKTALLVLLWFVVPVMRVTMPSANIYGGVRQIMEFIPAMAILSGIGAGYIAKLLYCYLARLKIKQFNNEAIQQLKIVQIGIILLFIPITIKLISLHPNEGLYFNPLIGGFKGAMSKNFLNADFDLGNPYKQAIIWINKNLEKDAKLALFSGLGSDIPGVQIREDIKFSNNYRSGFERRGEYVLGLMENVRLDSYSSSFAYDYYNNFLIPVHEIKVEGVAIVKFWKNDREHAKPQYKGQRKIEGATYQILENALVVNLEKPVRVTKVNIFFDRRFCDRSMDGSIEIETADLNWLILDDHLSVTGFYSTFYNFKSATEFVYPIAAIRTKSIKFTFVSPQSCFRNDVENVAVYGLPN